MKKILCFAVPLLLLSLLAFSQVTVGHLTCENLTNPLGIDALQPQFGWQLASSKRGVLQTAYELRVSDNAAFAGAPIWSSGKVSSEQSVHVRYNGSALQPASRYYWQVRVWDNNNKASAWSAPAYWQMGLLQPSHWQATWIEPGYTEDSVMRPSPLFRKEFTAAKKIKTATAFITSHGIYEAFINGKRVGDYCLTPGWTSYNKRLQYQVYDVTNLLQQGNNAVGAMLGSGWYRGYLAWNDNKDVYGKTLGLLMQINLTYADGSTETVSTDGSWKSTTGEIKSSEIYDGEMCDARNAKTGWTTAGYNDAQWSGVMTKEYDKSNLIATCNEPITEHETFAPVQFITTPKGEQVIDFGQNLVGYVLLTVSGKAGDTIRLQHAEVLDKNGNFYTDNLRAAAQEDVYVLSGKENETFHPHFTFQGFRYVKINGFKGEIKPQNCKAVALYSNMKPTGSFSTSNALLNQLQHNIQWGQRGNFLDVPTDCPQRDERLGWTGDAQVFSRTASYNYDVNNFFRKWMKDVAADQYESGSVPHVIPNVLGANNGGSAGWADVATIIPWNMYLAYADTTILRNQYESMKQWVGYMHDNSTNHLWNNGGHFGDWLFYRPEDDNDGRSAITDKYLIAQCFFARSVQLLINTAEVLGKKDDKSKYIALLKDVKDAFVKEYLTPNVRLISSSQTAYVLALQFEMLPENLRQQAADRLVENIKSYGNHLTTGFLGTPYLCHVLSGFGHTDVAYTLLMQKSYPSWLYPVTMGATTIWERWDGQKPDSTFQTPGMNSFNHYAYGAIGDWMYRVMAGMDTYSDAPGYKHIRIKPHPDTSLQFVNASYETNYGTLRSQWQADSSHIAMDITVPCNTTATIYIPAKEAGDIREGSLPLAKAAGIKLLGKEDDYIKLEAGSGTYHFTAPGLTGK